MVSPSSRVRKSPLKASHESSNPFPPPLPGIKKIRTHRSMFGAYSRILGARRTIGRRLAVTQPAVLQVIPALNAGGAERSTIDIAKALVAEGFRALVVSEGGRMEHELVAAGAELIRMPVASKAPLRIFNNAGALADIIRTQNVVLAHARSRAP